MKLLVNSFRGIQKACIDLGSITLIAGKNAQGKTSIMQGAIACTCQTVPLDVDKKHAALLVKSGNASGEAELQTDTGSVKVTFPDANKSSKGEALEISPIAAGVDSFLDYKKEGDRAKAFVELLKAYPTKIELLESLRKAGYEKLTDDLWKTIEVHGWDQALKNSTDKGALLKGEWRGIAGEEWGSKKAETWEHQDSLLIMPAEFKGEPTVDGLSKFLSDCKELLNAANRDAGATEQQKNDLMTKAEKVPALTAEVKDLETSLQGLFKNREDMEKGLKLLPLAEQPKSIECPHCKGLVQFENGKLSTVTLLTDEEIMSRNTNIIQAKISIDKVKDEIVAQNDKYFAKKAELKEAQEAGTKLSKISKRRKDAVNIEGAVKNLEAMIDTTGKKIAAIQKTEQARAIHNKILANLEIVNILKPEGLRQEVLIRTMSKYNTALAQLCKLASWPRQVEVKDNMQIVIGGTLYQLASKGEQYCIRVALQVAAAMFDGSKLVLIDDSDDILGAWRGGLFKALLQLKIQAVIVLATDRKDLLPDLSRFGGNVYWVEGGEVVEVLPVSVGQ
jgi:hypothetical protein